MAEATRFGTAGLADEHGLPADARRAPLRAQALPMPDAGAAAGGVRGLLRAEGLVLLALALGGYAWLGAGWGAFALLFLLPDLALLAYLAGPRAGALAYNATHSLLVPAGLLAAGGLADAPQALALGLIWTAHIGFDRMLGYGLKYARGFAHTHLGRLGPADPW